MGTVSVSLPSDGQTIDAADYNTPINTIVSEINGNLDDSNIASDAAIDRSKISGFTDGWEGLGHTPNTVTYNGNRSYSCVFSSTDLTGDISPGMRIKTTRTVTAPTQCADLESGSSQYFTKTSPTGLSFTTTFTCMAWVKLESYGANSGIICRRNANTEGWSLAINSSGQVVLDGLRIAANNKSCTSTQSIPLNRWVHVAVSMDMTAGASSGATWYIDGVSVPGTVTQTGTATAIVQGTTALNVGAENSGGSNPFDGKIAQAAVFSAVISAANIRSYISQGLSGSETSLVSAYSLSNSIVDLAATDNDLSAVNSAVATATDSPYAVNSFGTATGTTDYGIVTSSTFSTDTTLVVQVPEGCTIPTSGGVSAVSYSTQKIPYGFVGGQDRWAVAAYLGASPGATTVAANTYTNSGSFQLTVPIGAWNLSGKLCANHENSSASLYAARGGLSTVNNTASDMELIHEYIIRTSSTSGANAPINVNKEISVSSATPYYGVISVEAGAGTITVAWSADVSPSGGIINVIKATCAYL
jgi:hypothetical protein